MLELEILLTALVIWGLTHHLQVALDRVWAKPQERLSYQLCNALRLLSIAVSAGSFLVWVWRHMPTMLRSLCVA